MSVTFLSKSGTNIKKTLTLFEVPYLEILFLSDPMDAEQESQ